MTDFEARIKTNLAKRRLVGVEEASFLSGVSTSQIRSWLKKKEIAVHKIGVKNWIMICDLEAYIDKFRIPAKWEGVS